MYWQNSISKFSECRLSCMMNDSNMSDCRSHSVIMFHMTWYNSIIRIIIINVGNIITRVQFPIMSRNRQSNKFRSITYICVNELGRYGFNQWLFAYSIASHYLIQCWLIFSRDLQKDFQLSSNLQTKVSMHENAFEKVDYTFSVNLIRKRCVKVTQISYF